MPRQRQSKDLFETIEGQARDVIQLIETEIADLEGRLARLREQHARWMAVLLGEPPPRDTARTSPRLSTGEPKVRTARAPRRTRAVSVQIDWDEVLKELPDRFSMSDVETATPALAENPRARIVAIARWSKAKSVKKVAAGVYEKVVALPRKRGVQRVPADASRPIGDEDRIGGAAALPIESYATTKNSVA